MSQGTPRKEYLERIKREEIENHTQRTLKDKKMTEKKLSDGCGKGLSGNWKEKPKVRRCGAKNTFCLTCKILNQLILIFQDHSGKEFFISNRQVINMIKNERKNIKQRTT